MNLITHFLASWSLAEASPLETRDRNLITWAGFAPDLDGLGAIPDMAANLLGYPSPEFYVQYHHQLLHGLFGALLLPVLVALLAKRRISTFFWSVLAVHLHLLCDLMGSRGAEPSDIWPIPYLAPFSHEFTLTWQGQWPINAWPNVAITIGLMVFMLSRTITQQHSPLSAINSKAHRIFVATVTARWRKIQPFFRGTTP